MGRINANSAILDGLRSRPLATLLLGLVVVRDGGVSRVAQGLYRGWGVQRLYRGCTLFKPRNIVWLMVVHFLCGACAGEVEKYETCSRVVQQRRGHALSCTHFFKMSFPGAGWESTAVSKMTS